ncbi:hypothetical protein DFH06DRAFT_1393376 [Mycena polygramma]|nr:hypothetical protein DFH06DRAFT_1393376 [Mycena polygramma]
MDVKETQKEKTTAREKSLSGAIWAVPVEIKRNVFRSAVMSGRLGYGKAEHTGIGASCCSWGWDSRDRTEGWTVRRSVPGISVSECSQCERRGHEDEDVEKQATSSSWVNHKAKGKARKWIKEAGKMCGRGCTATALRGAPDLRKSSTDEIASGDAAAFMVARGEPGEAHMEIGRAALLVTFDGLAIRAHQSITSGIALPIHGILGNYGVGEAVSPKFRKAAGNLKLQKSTLKVMTLSLGTLNIVLVHIPQKRNCRPPNRPPGSITFGCGRLPSARPNG